jgi:regulatory protein
MLRAKLLSKEQALQKLRHYCAYQDRCHAEVKEKLYSYGLRKQDVEASISQLIEEGCLNEERFAIQFAGGKFRTKQWGRVKIKYELKQKRVSDYCIRRALAEIGKGDYQKTAEKLARKKWNSIKEEGAGLFVKTNKTRNYMLQKGFESVVIAVAISQLTSKKE